MKDPQTIERIKLLHPAVREEAAKIYDEICVALTGSAICRFAYTLRSFAEQDILFAKKPKVTNAKGGESYHNYGLAIDIVLLRDKDKNGTFETASWETDIDFDGDGVADWQEVVKIFKQYGWSWGGDWKFTDKPHFEKTFNLSVRELLARHNNKRVDANGYVYLG